MSVCAEAGKRYWSAKYGAILFLSLSISIYLSFILLLKYVISIPQILLLLISKRKLPFVCYFLHCHSNTTIELKRKKRSEMKRNQMKNENKIMDRTLCSSVFFFFLYGNALNYPVCLKVKVCEWNSKNGNQNWEQKKNANNLVFWSITLSRCLLHFCSYDLQKKAVY